MPGVILTIQIERRSAIPGLSRTFPSIRKEALQDTALHWHEEMLPQHFAPSNRARYQHEARSPFYLKEIKPRAGQGQGRFVDNVLKGQSKRFMQAFFKVSGSAQAATLTMRPPVYFGKPFIGSFRDAKTGETKRITRQPDKPAEVTRVDRRDAEALSQFAAQRIAALVAQAQVTQTTTIKG